MPLTFAPLQTDRLVMRVPSLDDAPGVFAAWSQDPEVARYLSWRPSTRIEEVQAVMTSRLTALGRGEVLPWVIVRRADKVLLGMIELRPEANHFGASIGYVLARSAWGKGYMTEALKAVLQFAFETPEIYRVWAMHDVDNPASGRVMGKAGMQREGVLRRSAVHPNVSNEPRDTVLYARVRSTF
jgi:ribosomal-protein-alanine N-acetyltransferase